MSTGTLDRDTLTAVGVLARAVEQARVPGVLEFRLLSSALRRTLESRNERELNDAAHVFESLDPSFRTRIVDCAKAEAEAYVEAHADAHVEAHVRDHPAPAPERAPARPARLPAGMAGRAPTRAATGFLAALNGFGRGARRAEPDSRETAKARLLAAVEQRRSAGDGESADSDEDAAVRAGDARPRRASV